MKKFMVFIAVCFIWLFVPSIIFGQNANIQLGWYYAEENYDLACSCFDKAADIYNENCSWEGLSWETVAEAHDYKSDFESRLEDAQKGLNKAIQGKGFAKNSINKWNEILDCNLSNQNYSLAVNNKSYTIEIYNDLNALIEDFNSLIEEINSVISNFNTYITEHS